MVVVAVIGTVIAIALGRRYDILALGERNARHLGIDVERLRFWSIILVALLTGAAVAFVGIIAFVGLVVPHLMRMIIGPSHRALLVASAFGGAVLDRGRRPARAHPRARSRTADRTAHLAHRRAVLLHPVVASTSRIRRLGMTGIQVDGVSIELGGRLVVQDVDLEVPTGELLALVGPNGAGKSTLLAAISGEQQPSSGRVLIGDRATHEYASLELARIRSMLTQDNAVSFPFLVSDVVEMGRSPWARTPERERDADAIEQATTRTDIAHLMRRRFTELSGGEKARVSLARVLAQDTPIVLLDEPTAALDLRHQEDVLRIARELAHEGRTVVVVLHDLSLAGAYADRVALLDDGRLRALGTPIEVLTGRLVSEVYAVDVEVLVRDGRPLIIPRRPAVPPR